MNLNDLAYSNSLYVLRTISKQEKSAEEIANETDMKYVSVKKILKRLLEKKIIYQRSSETNSIGRPIAYYGINSNYFCALIIKSEYKFDVYYIYTNGKCTKEFDYPAHYAPSESLRIVRSTIGSYNENCLEMFLFGEGIDSIDDVTKVTKTDMLDLAYQSAKDEEKVVFVALPGCNILINHGKAKIINASKEETEEIIDIDEFVDYQTKTNFDFFLETVPKIAIKRLENKI